MSSRGGGANATSRGGGANATSRGGGANKFGGQGSGFDARDKIRPKQETGGSVFGRLGTEEERKARGGANATAAAAVKAPSRPQDRLLNEVEVKPKVERKKTEAELKKEEEERKKAEEEKKKKEEEERKSAEEAVKQASEELRRKAAEEAVKAAPPSKPPQTPEEVAREEEIQQKIRESIVIINPEHEVKVATQDPSKDLEMSQELRDLLKTITGDYVCRLCSVRIVGPHMAAMHYNGKNHMKKLRNFVQTNGRSAGYNLATTADGAAESGGKEEEKKKKAEGENGEKETTQVVDATAGLSEKEYCKLCKVAFQQEVQADMHYKGKNHAKKVRNLGAGGNGPEVFECKICCVTVTAQEHLTAHLNGTRHKLQLRKMDINDAHRGGLRGGGGRGYSFGFGGRGGRGGRGGGGGGEGGSWQDGAEGGRGRGGRGRGRGRADFSGSGFKRPNEEFYGAPSGFHGPTRSKRPRF